MGGLVLPILQCSKGGASGTGAAQVQGIVASDPLGGELPASHFLSEQDQVNPGTAGGGGYDPTYRMLTFRRLEDLPLNPPQGSPGHVEGVRAGTSVIRVPASGEDMTSLQLMRLFTRNLQDPGLQFGQVRDRVRQDRAECLRRFGVRPRVLVAGLGPVGLLTVLESYAAGSSVVGVEQRSQYTRPQILRLTSDTVERIRAFTGDPVWDQLLRRGVVSRSPNWAQNKFDTGNGYLYPRIRALQDQIRQAPSEVQARALTLQKKAEEAAIVTAFSPQERTLRDGFLRRGMELETVDIVRINALETILAAVVEELARLDPDHLRVYYGGALTATAAGEAFALRMTLKDRGATVNYPLAADLIAGTEGAGGQTARAFGVEGKVITQPLYGATAAFRLPTGFDISLRPVENQDGTASVKGIALIDAWKLTPPGPHAPFHWSMVQEGELARELDQILTTAAHGAGADPSAPSLLLPRLPAEELDAFWTKRNGGNHHFLPRTRYFFAGGLVYLGAELTREQFDLFRKRADPDLRIRAAADKGLREFMLLLAEKHMPREYIQGQTSAHLIAAPAEGSDAAAADRARVITLTEPRSSLSTFPIALRRAPRFFYPVKVVHSDALRTARLVLLGDSFATTHFFTGSGAVNGLRAAANLGRVLAGGGTDSAWATAERAVAKATDEMIEKVVLGTGNAPLDGPFNEPLGPGAPEARAEDADLGIEID